jgi:hypothetical protein
MNTKFFLLFVLYCSIQLEHISAQVHHFPQLQINKILKEGKFNYSKPKQQPSVITDQNQNAFQCVKQIERLKKTDWKKFIASENNRALDTVYVGAAGNDTLVITGSYTHQGPIFVFNNGVLIIHNASFLNEGDVYVFGHGKLLCDSSSLTFPQQYFYQRGLFVVHHATAYFKDMSFNYSGVQHNLVVGDSATLAMDNVHQNDWTTAGLYGHASLFINGMNLGGEYILTDSSTSIFKHVDTLLLWHKFPQNAVIDHSFPQGDTVYNYYFSNLVPNIAGVNYVNLTDSCYTVWWGIMPVNGSDVTLQNSNIRVAGAWFQFGDSLSVTGIQNNTFYPNTLIPLADRVLKMMNTFVNTWSFYVFDSSYVAISNCTLGEVGTQQTAQVVAQDMLLDGSGGYFWATDTSFTYALNVTSYSTTRSEKNGIFLLAYSDMPFAAPTSTGNSLVISAQNNTAADPFPYDNALAWNQKIDGPSIAHTDSLIPIIGSAWINQGPNGSWMDFESYSLYYQLLNSSIWTPIVLDSTIEVSHSALGIWNTYGLQAGNYVLKQLVRNNLGDSIETYVGIELLAGIVATQHVVPQNSFFVYPQPSSDLVNVNFEILHDDIFSIYLCDITGKKVLDIDSNRKLKKGGNTLAFEVVNLSNGLYFLKVEGHQEAFQSKLLVRKN